VYIKFKSNLGIWVILAGRFLSQTKLPFSRVCIVRIQNSEVEVLIYIAPSFTQILKEILVQVMHDLYSMMTILHVLTVAELLGSWDVATACTISFKILTLQIEWFWLSKSYKDWFMKTAKKTLSQNLLHSSTYLRLYGVSSVCICSDCVLVSVQSTKMVCAVLNMCTLPPCWQNIFCFRITADEVSHLTGNLPALTAAQEKFFKRLEELVK